MVLKISLEVIGKFHCRSSNINGMQCILQISPTRFLIGGHQDKLVDFNLTSCKETIVVSFKFLTM